MLGRRSRGSGREQIVAHRHGGMDQNQALQHRLAKDKAEEEEDKEGGVGLDGLLLDAGHGAVDEDVREVVRDQDEHRAM